MDLKQKLATLIDAYADARRTGNEMLMQLAAEQLQRFFAAHDVIPVEIETEAAEAPNPAQE